MGSGDQIRVFFGVPLPENAIQVVNQAIQPLRREFPKVRWVHPDLLHITVLFVGNVDDEELRNQTIWKTAWTGDLEASTSEVQHGGVFYRNHVPATFYLTVSDPPKILSEIRKRLEKAFFPKRKPQKFFLPHITVARKRSRQTTRQSGFVPRFLESLRSFSYSIPIDRVNLYRSELTPERPYYMILKQWQLPPPSGLTLLD